VSGQCKRPLKESCGFSILRCVLLRPSFSELLDPEFTEIGASGRWWDAESILTVTSDGTVSSESPVKVSKMSGTVMAPGIVHLTYFADNQGRRAWRSSLWRLTETGWRMYFHQGTLAS
jgi:hypothetical protein